VLCFVRTKHGASRLARQLEKDGMITSAIHGDKTQAARLEALAKFKEGKLQVLVATDVAARGLDIDDLPLVVNYELPHVPEDYVHRIGRTGRAGCAGSALSLVSSDEQDRLRAIERLLGRRIDVLPLDRSAIAPAASATAAARAEAHASARKSPGHRAPAPGERHARPAHGPAPRAGGGRRRSGGGNRAGRGRR